MRREGAGPGAMGLVVGLAQTRLPSGFIGVPLAPHAFGGGGLALPRVASPHLVRGTHTLVLFSSLSFFFPLLARVFRSSIAAWFHGLTMVRI